MLYIELNTISLLKNNDYKIVAENINVSVEESSIVSQLGKNGSGKTTILKSILQLLDKRFYKINGKILFNNCNLLNLTTSEIQTFRKSLIKFVPQDSSNSFDPLKKLGYYFDLLKPNEKLLDEYLKKLSLPLYKEIKEYYPHQLSGGMAQRLSIILAVVLSPKILLLDEPTSALDPPIVSSLIKILKEYVSKGNSVLLVTQDIDFSLAISDKIFLLENGTSTKSFTPDKIINDANLNLSLINAYRELKNVTG